MLKRQNLRYWNAHLRRKGGPLILGLLFLLGAAAGTRLLSLCGEDTLEILKALLNTSKETTLLEHFLNSFSTEALQLGLLFFCGFCAIGQPAALFLLIYRGLGLGLMGSYLAQQGREAFLYYALILLPRTLIFLLIQIIATVESISFSMSFFRQLLGGSRTHELPPGMYILRFLLLLVLIAAASAGTAVLTLVLSK